nr:AAA family ATPase [Austwickia sp. TVS 96-490-7B]
MEEVAALAGDIHRTISTVVEGKDDIVTTALTVLLAGGHLLLEDVPGVGKTTLAKALAAAVDCTMSRIQFTPDLLPSDITGVNIFNTSLHRFDFRPGAIFANVVVCDEINRASPKTQSAVLECMEEGQVSVDGTTYALSPPFLVVATQNPLEMEGTYPLPEAQRDRFMARLSMGYPSRSAELEMLDVHGKASPLEGLRAVATAARVQAAVETARMVHASQALKEYVVDLVTATREDPGLRLGASPRAALHLLRAARARAAISNRGHVIPDDVQALFAPVVEHRILLSGQAQLAGRGPGDVLADLLARVPVRGV